MKATGGCGTIFSGGIDSFNGVYSRELTESELDLNGHANIRNSEYYIFCTEDYLHGNNHCVNHLTIGGFLDFAETDMSIHSETVAPLRLNVISRFLAYTGLNLSGRIIADISRMYASGEKIYSAA